MKKKIVILTISLIGAMVSLLIYTAAELTKLRDSDILDISFDDDTNGEF